MKFSIKAILVYGLLFILFALFIRDYFRDRNDEQWDFKIYYYSSLAFSKGLNPYDINQVSQLSQIKYEFVYLPATLYFFKLYNLLDYGSASLIYFILQLLFLIFLFALWKKYFLKTEFDHLLYLFSFFAFNSAILIDLVTGNISIIEQVFLWSAFYFYLEKKAFLFCLLILFISLFKITPIFFIILLFLSDFKFKYRYASITVLIFALYIIINVVAENTLFIHFLDNVKRLDYGGISNPSSYFFIKDILLICQNEFGLAYSLFFNCILYLIFIGLLLFYSFRKISLCQKSNAKFDPRIILFCVIIVYALIAPRFMSYSFIILVVPSYYLIKHSDNRTLLAVLVLLVMLTANSPILSFGFLNTFWQLFWNYYPLFITIMLFMLYQNLLNDDSKHKNKAIPGICKK